MGFYVWLNLKYPSPIREQVIEKTRLALALIDELLDKKLVKIKSVYVLEKDPLVGVARELVPPIRIDMKIDRLASRIGDYIRKRGTVSYFDLINAEIVVNFYSYDAGNGTLILHGASWRRLKGDIEIDLYEDRFLNLVEYFEKSGMDLEKVFENISSILKDFNTNSTIFTCSRAILARELDDILTKNGAVAEFYNSPHGLARAITRWLFLTYEDVLKKVKKVSKLKHKERRRFKELSMLDAIRKKDSLADAAIRMKAVDMDIVIPRMASHEAFRSIIKAAARESNTGLSWHSVVLVNAEGLTPFYRSLAQRTIQKLAAELKIDYLDLIEKLDKVLKG